jgi:transcriptional pleiotropic regulator of transition state genes
MKQLGIVRRTDDLGRVVIPKEVREILKIKENDALEMFINNDTLILKKWTPKIENEKEKMNCKKCGKPLSYEDTFDIEGGIEENCFAERQSWTCENCNTEYIIEKVIEFNKKDIKTVYFEENT